MADIDARAVAGAIYGVINIRAFAWTWLHSKTCYITSMRHQQEPNPFAAAYFSRERLCCMTYREIRLEKYTHNEHVRSRKILRA